MENLKIFVFSATVLVVALAFSLNTFADDGKYYYDLTECMAQAKTELPLYELPPRSVPFLAFLKFNPKRMDGEVIAVGETFRIEEVKYVPTLGEVSVWPYVKSDRISGWIYIGDVRKLSLLKLLTWDCP